MEGLSQINPEDRRPEGFIWLKPDIRETRHRSYPKKTIEIEIQGMYLYTSLEFIILIVVLGFMGYTSRKRTKETDSTINYRRWMPSAES